MGHEYDNGSKPSLVTGDTDAIIGEALGFAFRLPERIKNLIEGWAAETGRPDIAREVLRAKFIDQDDNQAVALSAELAQAAPGSPDPLRAFCDSAAMEVEIHYTLAKLPAPENPTDFVAKLIRTVPGVLV